MVSSIVGDTITKITERMTSLRVFGDKTIAITENIKRHLLTVKEVVEHNDVATPTPTPGWLFDVTDAITDLWDLLDDHLPADADLLPKQSNIRCYLTPSGPLLHLEEIEKRLQHLAKLLPKNSEKLTELAVEDREIEIVGRQTDKEDIIRRILALTKVEGAVPVVSIAGMQGIGKTALAKLVRDDDRVKGKFDLVIWIDGVHDEFYAESVVKRMIHESASMKKKKLEEKDSIVMDENLNLREAMSGRRFFLVLDDLRSENREEWLKLQQKLAEAASSSGGAVLVTTRNSLVANVVAFQSRRPSTLGEEDSWTLYEQIAGGDPSESESRDTQKKMVSKCRGVPVAILTMARMLRSREAITESEITHLEKEFMQQMKTIYYDKLPSLHLKQCFAYLSLIFSRTNQVQAETLIKLWVAEGFLGPVSVNSNSSSSSSSSCSSRQTQPEDLGLCCIQEFRRRSILQVQENTYGILTNCSMNNGLLLELSKFVAGKDRFCMDDGDEDVKETVRRVAVSRDFDVSNGTLKSLFANNKNLRTLLCGGSSRIPNEVKLSEPACDAIFCAFNGLRVLNLIDLGMKILPISIGKLKSLRYLDLSHNNMKKLPKSIGKLKHLQTLILSHCHELRKLPSEVKHLVSLKHLEMEECLHLTHMPSALKKLTNLQILSNFVVSTSNNQKPFRGLVNLKKLRRKLEISHLERLKFVEPEQDQHAYLGGKEHLKCLVLKWNRDDEDNNKGNNGDQLSLDHLKPHPDLQELCIVGYRDAKFSKWLSSLENLVSLILYNCSTCKSLPPLHQFPKLELLELKRLDSLEYIADQSVDCNKPGLELLEALTISDCPKLTSWWEGRTHNNAILFSSIKKLVIAYCPKLDCMPLFPNLDNLLELEGSSVKPLLETINYASASNSRTASDLASTSNSSLPLSKLLRLSIKNVEERSPLPEDWLKNFFSLQRLSISEKMSLMKGFKHLNLLNTMIIIKCTRVDLPGDEWEGLESLRYLTIQEVVKLKSLPDGIKHLAFLTKLWIVSCSELETLTEGIGDLKSLEFLLIRDCHKLASLPKGMANLTSLNELRIRNCPLLLPRCQKETGDDWPQIKHIKDIHLSGTSEVYEQ